MTSSNQCKKTLNAYITVSRKKTNLLDGTRASTPADLNLHVSQTNVLGVDLETTTIAIIDQKS